jgi:hypothetical protein
MLHIKTLNGPRGSSQYYIIDGLLYLINGDGVTYVKVSCVDYYVDCALSNKIYRRAREQGDAVYAGGMKPTPENRDEWWL